MSQEVPRTGHIEKEIPGKKIRWKSGQVLVAGNGNYFTAGEKSMRNLKKKNGQVLYFGNLKILNRLLLFCL